MVKWCIPIDWSVIPFILTISIWYGTILPVYMLFMCFIGCMLLLIFNKFIFKNFLRKVCPSHIQQWAIKDWRRVCGCMCGCMYVCVCVHKLCVLLCLFAICLGVCYEKIVVVEHSICTYEARSNGVMQGQTNRS